MAIEPEEFFFIPFYPCVCGNYYNTANNTGKISHFIPCVWELWKLLLFFWKLLHFIPVCVGIILKISYSIKRREKIIIFGILLLEIFFKTKS